MPYFCLTYSLKINPALFHKTYSFSLKEPSKFTIYSFKNDMDNDDDLVFSFSKIPNDETILYLYYSINDISDNIESLISCNPYTGEFFGSFYNFQLKSMSNSEVVVNSNKCDGQYLMPGYIYAVISIVATTENPEYSSELIIYNTKFMPEISISNKYEYYKIRGPYNKDITFFIPLISENIILRLGYFSLRYDKDVLIYQNNLTNIFYKDTIGNKYDKYIKLTKGYNYYIQIHNYNHDNDKQEFLFQFPSDEFIKIEEGKVIYASTFKDNYYYFYYDNSDMNIETSLYLKITRNHDKTRFYYKELLYNDIDYINQRKNPDNTELCSLDYKLNYSNIISYFYQCRKTKESQAFLFMIKSEIETFTYFEISIFSKTNIDNPEGVQKIFKKGQVGFYFLDLNKLKSFNKNILIYTNGNEALNFFCYYYEYWYRSLSRCMRGNYIGMRLVFLDPSDPGKLQDRYYSTDYYYSIILSHPLLDEYSLDIKFIDKNIYFIKELVSPLQEKMIRRSYYYNLNSCTNIYQTIKYGEKNDENIESYSITFQELYGIYEIEIIILDNIKIKTIDELLNQDFSFNSKYITNSLSAPSILSKYMFIHIKLNSGKSVPLPYAHIAFYESIIKIDFKNEILSEGEQLIKFLEKEKPTYISFLYPYDDFNLEIKFFGKAISHEYIVNIYTCDGKEVIINKEMQIYRGRCKNVNSNTKIILINEGSPLTGVIIKRALKSYTTISHSLGRIEKIGRDDLLIFEKGMKNLDYFLNELTTNISNNRKIPYCLYQEYSDLEYISYPPKQSCISEKKNTSLYNNFSINYNMIYDEKSAKGRFIDSDVFNLFIQDSDDEISLNFKRIFKVNDNDIEGKDFISKANYDMYYYKLPKKNSINNFDSLFIQYLPDWDYYCKFYLLDYDGRSIDSAYFYKKGIYFLKINNKNQLYLYIEHLIEAVYRFKLFNSKSKEFINYNYEKNINEKSYIFFQIKDNNIFPHKIEIRPNIPHEINGCHNYYFFILDPKYKDLIISTYYQFKNLNSSVFYQNFTAENVCSQYNKFLDKDLYKFIFDFNMRKNTNITILGFSEQVGLLNAVKFEEPIKYPFYYKPVEFYSIKMKIYKSELIILNNETEETTKYKISFENEGLLNIFWKGSNSNKIQDVEIYKSFNVISSNLFYKSLNLSNYEHNYSIKVNKESKYILIYKSKEDEFNSRTIFFDFTQNLGKEFYFKKNENILNYSKNWIIYTSGIYKFYIKINENDINTNNEFYSFKYNFKKNNYNSVSEIKLKYFNEKEVIIKSYEIKGNVNKKIIDSENRTFFYFTTGDNIKSMFEKENLRYIQIEFKLKFEDECVNDVLDEISIEAISTLKIKDKNWNKKINDLFKENSGKLGIYYINLKEAIFKLNQHILFYTNSKNLTDILFIGNILDFCYNKNNSTNHVYDIEKQFLFFNKETINNYESNYNESIIFLVIDGTKKNKNFIKDNIFLEFKYLDANLNDITFTENWLFLNYQETFSFYSLNECNNKKKYFIIDYTSSKVKYEKILFLKNIYGKTNIYYANETFIFSDTIKSIEDIFPDKDDKYLIDKHSNEITKGQLNIIAITCKKAPALSVFYSFEKEKEQNNKNITFYGNDNSFIGYIYPEYYSQLEYKLNFENNDSEGFIIKLKIIKILGFNGINIKFRRNNSEEFSELEEGQEKIIESTKSIPSFQIEENGIGQGIIFFEIIKGISIDENLFNFFEDFSFDYELSKNKYGILKYNKKTQIESVTARIILINENDKESKVCIKYGYYNEPFISLPDCNEYIKISSNSKKNLLISNPYKIKNNIFISYEENEEEADFYIIMKSDSPIKFIYIYSNSQENLPLNTLKYISNTGDFIYKLEEKLPEKKYFIYQLNHCYGDKRLYLIFGSKIYDNFGKENYGIQRKEESNLLLSIINEEENNQTNKLYFTISESDINNDNIDELFNQTATFTYRREKNDIIFNIDNFAEEEFMYYSIITLYNNSDNLKNFCFFIEFFDNNKTLFSQSLSKGKGINSKTNITHSISDEFFSRNCTIMIFAKSELKNISKIYSPKIINISEKYNGKILYIIIACSVFVLIVIVFIIIFIIKIKKKRKQNVNGITNKINEINFVNLEKKLLDKSSNSSEKIQKQENNISQNSEINDIDLPSESQIITKKSTTGLNFGAAPSL